MPEILTVCAYIKVKKNNLGFVKSEAMKLVKSTLDEKGCIQYILHQDIDQPEIFIFFEKWENNESCEKHMKNNHTKEFINAVDKFVVKIKISKIRELI